MRKFLVGLIALAVPVIASCRDSSVPVPVPAPAPEQNPVSTETGNVTANGTLLVDMGFTVDDVVLDDRGCPPDETIQGQQVVFKDGSGATVGVATLNASEKVHQSDPPQRNPANPESGYPIFCGYGFEVAELPRLDFYTLTVGGGMETTVTGDEIDQAIVLMAR